MTDTTHPAITRAQAVYDKSGDLEPHEQVFLTAVHQATMLCARTKGEANSMWGDGSRAAIAAADLSDRRQASDLTRALEVYERDVEAADELEEVAYAMAAE